MIFDYSAQPKETLEVCNLCGAEEWKTAKQKDRYGYEVEMATCFCGLRFLNPRMTPDAYRAFYSEGHYRRLLSDYYGRPFGPEDIESEQRRYAARLGEFLGPHMNGRETVLDVGGSTGAVSFSLEQWFGLDCTVLEVSEREAARAESKGMKVVRGTLEDRPPLDPFDVVLLCQTVDHLMDIGAGLEAIHDLLKLKGLFFVDIVEDGPVKVDHPYYLTRETMSRYLGDYGFLIRETVPAGDGLHVNFACEAA